MLKTYKRTLAALMVAVMLLGTFVSLHGASVPVFAETASVGIRNSSNAVLDKKAWLTEDGTYTIELSAFTKGSVEISSIESTVPVDVILLLDQSYSMADHGTLLGRSFDCYHTTAIKEASKKLVEMLSASSTDTVQHRMAIAAYGCENTFLAQYFPSKAGSTNSYPYAGSELYVGSNEFRYNGTGCSYSYDPEAYVDENNIGTVTAEGIDYYDNGAHGGYPSNSAQAHYNEAMRNVLTQKNDLLASIEAYDPNPADRAERGGTAMHVGMKMVEGIMDAYRPDPTTHENMYFKPDADQTPTYHFVASSSSRESWFFEDPNGSVEFYVNDPVNGTIANCGYCACPYGDPRFTGSNYQFIPDIFNGNEYQGSIKGFYTWIKDTDTGRKTKGNWIRGYWEEDDRPYQMINGVKVYGTWENRKKVVIIFTDGYVGDTAFRPDWANLCMQSAGRIKNGTYGEAATVYTVGLVWDEPEMWIHDRMDVAWNADYTVDPPIEADMDDGIYKNYIHFAYYGRQVFNTGEYFPPHFFDNPHNSLLKKFLGYLSSNYIPNAQGQFPTQAVQYIGGYNPTLIVSDHDAGFKNPNLTASYTSGGLEIDNYFIDAHNTLSDPNTADIENIDRLVESFKLISSEIITIGSDGGASASLSNDAVLRDYLSNYFEMPDDFSLDNVKVELALCTGINGDNYSFGARYDHPSAIVDFNTGTGSVSVKNLKLSACGVSDSGSVYGNKIFVTITGILARSFAVGDNLPTNDNTLTGIYADEDSAEPGLKFPLPRVDIRQKYVVYDFSTLLMEEHSYEFFDKRPDLHDVLQILTLDDCYKSQRTDSGITYNSTYPYVGCTDHEDKVGVFEASIVGDSLDNASFKPKKISWKDYELGALLKCDPNKNDGVEYEWCKIIFLPATNVHYEEDCLDFFNGGGANLSIWTPSSANTAGNWQLMNRGTSAGNQSSANGGLYNEYGYCSGYAVGGHEDSNGISMHVNVDSELLAKVRNGAQWPKVNFTFTGTGFDLISHSGANTGVLSVDIVPHGENINDPSIGRHIIVDTYYANNAYLCQIPVLRVVDLEWLEEGYDVWISALYNPLFEHMNKSGVIEAGTIPGLPENVEYEFVKADPSSQRPATKLGEGSFDVFVDAIRVYNPRGENLEPFSGIDYVAYSAANELNPKYVQIRSMLLASADTDPSAMYIDSKDGDVSIEEYGMFGPNNEAYLWAAPAGQNATKAIAFSVANWSAQTTRVHISAKAPSGVVRMYVNGEFVADIESATELYYDITDIIRDTTNDGHVVISAEQASNAGAEQPVLSLVNVKIIGQTTTPSDPEYATVTWVDGITYEVLKTKTVIVGGRITDSDFPTPVDHSADGYAFVDWSHSAGIVTGDLTIMSQYTLVQGNTLTVRFRDQVTGLVFRTWDGIEIGTVLAMDYFPTAPVHEGYTFVGHNYTPGTPIYEDTEILYEYEQEQFGKVTVNFYMDAGSSALSGAQLLFDKDHNTYGDTVPEIFLTGLGYAYANPAATWYAAMEYLIPGDADIDGTIANGSTYTNIEIDPGTYDFYILTKINNAWQWRGEQSWFDDIYLPAGTVVDISYNGGIDIVVNITTDPSNSVRFTTSVDKPTLGGVQLSSGGLMYPIFANIETFNFAEAILAGKLGDANHDRRVDITDAVLVMRRALGMKVELDAYGKYCADFNKDRTTDIADVLGIIRFALGLN